MSKIQTVDQVDFDTWYCLHKEPATIFRFRKESTQGWMRGYCRLEGTDVVIDYFSGRVGHIPVHRCEDTLQFWRAVRTVDTDAYLKQMDQELSVLSDALQMKLRARDKFKSSLKT